MIGKLVTAAMTAALFVFFILFGTLMGALSGWVVGWFFAETILTFFSYIFGYGGTIDPGLQMWEAGASLGFISGFFRTRVKVSEFPWATLKDWMGKRRAETEADAVINNPRQPVPPPKPTIVRG